MPDYSLLPDAQQIDASIAKMQAQVNNMRTQRLRAEIERLRHLLVLQGAPGHPSRVTLAHS